MTAISKSSRDLGRYTEAINTAEVYSGLNYTLAGEEIEEISNTPKTKPRLTSMVFRLLSVESGSTLKGSRSQLK
jgi:hypothetical protein